MSLIRWFRKNNTKVMAVVVIVIMFGFVGGTWLQQVAKKRGNPVVARYMDGQAIRQSDIAGAQRELEVLRALRAPDLLQSQDLFGLLMSELLFSDDRQASQMVNALKRVARENQYRISESQIYELYQRSVPSSIYWILLKAEAYEAGVVVPTQDAGQLLGRIIPQVSGGASYSQFMPMMIERFQLPEQSVLHVFAQLLAVMQYAQTSCSMQDVTLSQVAHSAAEIRESANLSLAEIRAEYFNDDVNEPTAEQIAAQFEAYKNNFAGDVSEGNPYGFGYKLSGSVQLEYMLVKLDDVAAVIDAPTQQDKEDYYQQHTDDFVESVPADPNDPNSITIDRTKTFTEVERRIDDTIRQQRTAALSNEIISAAAEITEAPLQDYDQRELTSEILAEKAGPYGDAAAQLSEKYKVDVVTASTGMLDARRFQEDEYLRRLYVRGYGASPVPLARMAFAVEELTDSNAPRLDVAVPKLYENVSPVRDYLGEVLGLIRITGARKAQAPENVDVRFSIAGVKVDEPNDPNEAEDDLWVVKDEVVEDLKDLAAMDIAEAKAEQFKQIAVADGFDKAIDKFNELYGEQAKESPDDPNVFRVQTMPQLQRVSGALMATSIMQNEGNPAVDFLVRQRNNERRFVDKIFSLVPPDANSLADTPAIMEFKPDLAYYCIKDLSMTRLWKEDYDKAKAMDIFRLDHVSSQSLAIVHFNPANIIERTGFKSVSDSRQPQEEQAEEPNAPADPVESSE